MTDKEAPLLTTFNSLPPCQCRGILSIPRPIIFSVFSYLCVGEIWAIRTVSKTFLNLCDSYFQEMMKELVLDGQWLCTRMFGRTDHLLRNCRSLINLSINNNGKISFTVQVLNVLRRISESECNLKEFCLRGFNQGVLTNCKPMPTMSENLLTVERLLLENIICNDWREVFYSFLEPSHQYKHLKHLTLRLTKYDGLELRYLGDHAPSLTTLDVSYCSLLRCEHLEYALKRWSKLLSVYLLYVPSVKNSTIRIFKEYCPDLTVLCVQGTNVSVEALTTLATQGVKIDILENNFGVFTRPLKMSLQI